MLLQFILPMQRPILRHKGVHDLGSLRSNDRGRHVYSCLLDHVLSGLCSREKTRVLKSTNGGRAPLGPSNKGAELARNGDAANFFYEAGKAGFSMGEEAPFSDGPAHQVPLYLGPLRDTSLHQLSTDAFEAEVA